MAKLFISYSHRDERALERLHTHLAMLRREGAIATWYDREILGGANIDEDVARNLADSDVFIPLVSPDFLASRYCYEKEMEQALHRHEKGSIRVVPIILEPCDWKPSPLAKLKVLPKDGKAISTWANQNVAYLDIVEELRRILSRPTVIESQAAPTEHSGTASTEKRHPRRYRLKREFDSIDKDEFREKAFAKIQDFFRQSIEELNEIGDPIRARFEEMGANAFTCTVLNKGARGQEAHITIYSNGTSSFHDGAISYSFSKRAAGNTANGFIRIEADEYELYLKLDNFSFNRSRNDEPRSIEQVAEALWQEFVSQAGIDHD